MEILNVINESWGWVGLVAANLVEENEFGNLIVEDTNGSYWRICPEELECEIIATNDSEFQDLLQDDDFLDDWEMAALVGLAVEKLGELPEGKKYHLHVPSVLGGEYTADNFRIVGIMEQIRYSGEVAKLVNGLPEGADVDVDFLG